jgi:phospholipid/cholesterol/gamma-HCH transport system substrate-binding protein
VTAAAAPQQGRFSIEALQDSKRAKAISGVVTTIVVVAIVWLIIDSFTGHFTAAVRIKAELPPGSSAVTIDAPVEYLNVTVGKVQTEGAAPDGNVSIVMMIYPQNMDKIPAGVEAQVAPLSIFGNQYVNLVPPAQIGTAHLLASDYVQPYGGAASTSLQGTTTQLYNLLHAVNPKDLDIALSAFAEALAGEGHVLGQTLSGGGQYLGTAVVPNLPTAENDISGLGTASNTLNANAPSVLATLANTAVTGRTLTTTLSGQEQALQVLLQQGSGATGQFASVLNQVQTQLPILLNESGPLLADVTQQPNELSQTLSGLTTFAGAVAAQETAGPFLSVNVQLPVANISAGVNAALGYDNPTSIDQALGPAVNPPTYSSADCPEYAGETNPYCGGGSPGGVPAAGSTNLPRATTTTSPSTTTPSATTAKPAAVSLLSTANSSPTDAEVQAVQEIASALNGGQAPPVPGLATIVLLPLLNSMARS